MRCCSTVDSGVGSGGSKPVDVVHSYNIYVYTHILIYSVDKGLTTSPPLSLSLFFFFFLGGCLNCSCNGNRIVAWSQYGLVEVNISGRVSFATRRVSGAKRCPRGSLSPPDDYCVVRSPSFSPTEGVSNSHYRHPSYVFSGRRSFGTKFFIVALWLCFNTPHPLTMGRNWILSRTFSSISKALSRPPRQRRLRICISMEIRPVTNMILWMMLRRMARRGQGQLAHAGNRS